MLVDKRDPRIPEFEEVKDKVTKAVKEETAKAQLEEKAKELIANAKTPGDLKAAAEKLGLEAKAEANYKLATPLGDSGSSVAEKVAAWHRSALEICRGTAVSGEDGGRRIVAAQAARRNGTTPAVTMGRIYVSVLFAGANDPGRWLSIYSGTPLLASRCSMIGLCTGLFGRAPFRITRAALKAACMRNHDQHPATLFEEGVGCAFYPRAVPITPCSRHRAISPSS